MLDVCLVDRETVTTFDGLNYNASISTCDQVLAKDCSGRYKFAVLARHEAGKKVGRNRIPEFSIGRKLIRLICMCRSSPFC